MCYIPILATFLFSIIQLSKMENFHKSKFIVHEQLKHDLFLVLKGSPMGLQTFFFFLGFLFPPPNIAFSEAKHNEGNLALTWYFRKTFL